MPNQTLASYILCLYLFPSHIHGKHLMMWWHLRPHLFKHTPFCYHLGCVYTVLSVILTRHLHVHVWVTRLCHVLWCIVLLEDSYNDHFFDCSSCHLVFTAYDGGLIGYATLPPFETITASGQLKGPGLVCLLHHVKTPHTWFYIGLTWSWPTLTMCI